MSAKYTKDAEYSFPIIMYAGTGQDFGFAEEDSCGFKNIHNYFAKIVKA
ncbi:MAG: hypothetical protein L3J74_10045 [Bacteroidales bacterium]|nr:hypothetical protein [Bacteroidales bacterium]